jgi:hypothetical protein
MASKKDNRNQSARFREAAKKVGGDQAAFEKVFKKIVPARKAAKQSRPG